MPGVSTPRFLRRLVLSCAMLAVAAGLGRAPAARAQIGSERYSAMVVDAGSGQVISAANPDDYRFPASLTKMMTIYMLFEAVRDHRVSLSDAVPVSAWAASMPPTKLGLLPGSYLTAEQALLGLVTKSANDAACALGELLGGDEERFAQMMTMRARSLGMSHTTFRNASGLPDWGQVTTARDMVVLARHLLQDFPEYYHYFSTPSFQFHGRSILNHQSLLRTYPGADGLKTGYIEASGYNVVTSAMRNDVRLIGVVFGASSNGERDAHMAALLDQGFQRMGVAPVAMARREYRVPFVSAARAEPMPAVIYAEPRAPRSWRVARAARPAAEFRRAAAYAVPYERAYAPPPAARQWPISITPRPPIVRGNRLPATHTAHRGWGNRTPG